MRNEIRGMRYSNFTLKPAIVFYFRLWVGLALIQLSVISCQSSVKNRGTIARWMEKLKIRGKVNEWSFSCRHRRQILKPGVETRSKPQDIGQHAEASL